MHETDREQNRLRKLRLYERLNPETGKQLSSFVEIATEFVEVDYAGIHFIDQEQQRVKVFSGEKLPPIQKSESICQYTIQQDEPLVIENLSHDARTKDLTYIQEELGYHSYAGVPLITREGYRPGTIGVMHREPREYNSRHLKLLSFLADEVVSKLEINSQKSQQEEIANEREWMIREIHHRLKNNLSVISGLLDLELMRTRNDETRELIDSTQRRIQSISNVHRKLYESESLERLNFKEYITDLIQSIGINFKQGDKEINYNVSGDAFQLGDRTAVTLGLLVNELVTNAFKHAFKEGESGEVNIILNKTDDRCYRIVVEDNGCGLPEDFSLAKNYSLGTQLISTLSKQLEADLEINSDHGTSVAVSFCQDGQ